MSDIKISCPIFVEDTGETIILKLPPQDARRVTKDAEYASSLIKAVYEKRNQNLIKQINTASISFSDEDLIIQSASSSSSISSLQLQESHEINKSDNSKDHDNDDNDKDEGNEKSLLIWSSKCVYLLLDKYEEYEGEFSAGKKRHNKIWEAIANDMRKTNTEYTMTGPQCQSKLNGLRKTYKKILDHNSVSGNNRKTWPYFTRMQEIFGKSGWANPKALASEAGPSNSPSNDEILENFFAKNDDTRKPKKRKIETVLDDFISDIKDDKIKKEEKRQAKAVWLDELKNQREQQHQEKMQMMQKLLEAMSKK